MDGVWRFSADDHVFGVTADEAGENAFLFGEVPAPSSGGEDAPPAFASPDLMQV